MSPVCEAFIRSLIQQKFKDAFLHLNGLNMEEMLRGMAALDRNDLVDLWDFVDDFSELVNMPRIQYAHDVVVKGSLPATAPGDLAATGQVNTARHFLAHRKPLFFEHDLTDTLPTPLASPPALTEVDFQTAAAAIAPRCEVASVMAVARVESGGRSGFGSDGRPIIRYELHIFDGRTKGAYRKTHPHLSQPTLAAGNPYHDGTQANEWSLMYNAMILREPGGKRKAPDALKSASWGMFQVMGFNFDKVGWTSIESFVNDMFQSEGNQLRAFTGFIASSHLGRALTTHDWARFASGYNGLDYQANNYDGNMAAAYANISAQRRRTHQVP